jgi:hypothetical protein
MVEYSPHGTKFTPHEYGVLEKNLAIAGDLLFRAHVVEAMHRSIRQQVRQRVQLQIAQKTYETPKTIDFNPDMSERIIDSLRGPADDMSKDYIIAREELQGIIASYDEQRRSQIVLATQHTEH